MDPSSAAEERKREASLTGNDNGCGNHQSFPLSSRPRTRGKGSHWFRVDKTMSKAIGADAGDTVLLSIEPVKEWSEPDVPADLKNALAVAPQAQALWMEITPMARWDWTRWIGATKQPETRKRRIGIALSKLKAGNRRP